MCHINGGLIFSGRGAGLCLDGFCFGCSLGMNVGFGGGEELVEFWMESMLWLEQRVYV